MTLLTLLTAATTDVASQSSILSLVMMIVLLIAFYFILIRPQRKKEKKDAEMRKNVQIGDEIVTAGGIVGIIVRVEESTVLLETGGDRSKLRIQKWAISQNLSAVEESKAAPAPKKAKSNEEEAGIEK